MVKLRRIIAFLIDYYILLMAGFIVAFIIKSIGTIFEINFMMNSLNFLINKIAMPIAILGLFVKDLVFKNYSIGKKLMNLEIRSLNNNSLSIFQLIARNLFYIVWPLEVLILIIIGKRLGDIIFKTEVVFRN